MAVELTDARRIVATWLALPAKLREPQTQRELAENLAIREATISEWKRDERFKADIRRLAVERLEGSLADVLEGVRQNAVKAERAEWVTMYFQIIGGAASLAPPTTSVSTYNTMTEDEATALLERSLNIKLTAHITPPDKEPTGAA
jgi:hypothetical protein